MQGVRVGYAIDIIGSIFLCSGDRWWVAVNSGAVWNIVFVSATSAIYLATPRNSCNTACILAIWLAGLTWPSQYFLQPNLHFLQSNLHVNQGCAICVAVFCLSFLLSIFCVGLWNFCAACGQPPQVQRDSEFKIPLSLFYLPKIDD